VALVLVVVARIFFKGVVRCVIICHVVVLIRAMLSTVIIVCLSTGTADCKIIQAE
jgi:hypothetical protein